MLNPTARKVIEDEIESLEYTIKQFQHVLATSWNSVRQNEAALDKARMRRDALIDALDEGQEDG